jgi:hypothetical protein
MFYYTSLLTFHQTSVVQFFINFFFTPAFLWNPFLLRKFFVLRTTETHKNSLIICTMLHNFVDENEDNPKPSMSQEAMLELYKMRLDNTLCDAVLEVDDHVTFNVHRNILSACSHYFR